MDPALGTSPPAPAPFGAFATPSFSVGSVIGRTFSIWAKNLVPFTALTLLTHLPTFALGLWDQYSLYGGYPSFQQIMERARMQQTAGAAPFVDWTPALIAGWVATMILGFVQIGALTYGVIQHLAGRKFSMAALLGAGFRRFVPVFFTGLMVWILFAGGTILLIWPGMLALCGGSVAIPAVITESKGPMAAIGRSFALTKARRFAIWVAFVVMFLVSWTASMFGNALPRALDGGMASLAGAVVAFVINGFVDALWPLLPAVAYHDLRVTKEGVDTEFLARVFE